jgi:hypothetical protein
MISTQYAIFGYSLITLNLHLLFAGSRLFLGTHNGQQDYMHASILL